MLGRSFTLINTCYWKPEPKSLDTMTAPTLSKLLRQETKFSSNWEVSGVSATSFNWAVLHKSDVSELMGDSEDTFENDSY